MRTELSQKLITCIIPKGRSHDIVVKLKQEYNILSANINSARGIGRSVSSARNVLGDQTEKDLLNLIVPAIRADEIFEYLFELAEIDRPHGGFIYMSALKQASLYSLPDDLQDEN